MPEVNLIPSKDSTRVKYGAVEITVENLVGIGSILRNVPRLAVPELLETGCGWSDSGEIPMIDARQEIASTPDVSDLNFYLDSREVAYRYFDHATHAESAKVKILGDLLETHKPNLPPELAAHVHDSSESPGHRADLNDPNSPWKYPPRIYTHNYMHVIVEHLDEKVVLESGPGKLATLGLEERRTLALQVFDVEAEDRPLRPASLRPKFRAKLVVTVLDASTEKSPTTRIVLNAPARTEVVSYGGFLLSVVDGKLDPMPRLACIELIAKGCTCPSAAATPTDLHAEIASADEADLQFFVRSRGVPLHWQERLVHSQSDRLREISGLLVKHKADLHPDLAAAVHTDDGTPYLHTIARHLDEKQRNDKLAGVGNLRVDELRALALKIVDVEAEGQKFVPQHPRTYKIPRS